MNIINRTLWILPFICFFAGYFTISLWYPTKELKTPAIVGKNMYEVAAILSNLNLNLRILVEKEDKDLEHGTIISQIPLAHDNIKQQQSMFVVVSKKPAPQHMPSLIGVTKDEVTKIIKNLGIHAHFYGIPTSQTTSTCIAQYPQAHVPINDISPIIYFSANSEQAVIMPNFKEMPVSEVVDFLHLYPVTHELIHEFRQHPTHQCIQCAVIDQRPMAGSIIKLNQEKLLHVQLLIN